MVQQVCIIGLSSRPTQQELEESRLNHNGLPTDDKQPPISGDILQVAAELFAQFKATDIFSLHLLHRHEELVEDTVIVGQHHPHLPGRWARRLAIDTVVESKIHGHLFRFKENCFRPYEYEVGPLPMRTTTVKHEFFAAFAEFLELHALQNVLALELIEQSYGAEMMEVEIRHQGTVMLPTSMLKGCKPYRQTGWKFEDHNGEARVCKDGKQHHGKGPQGTGHITTQGSLGRKLESFDEALLVLRSADILSDATNIVL
jgi:hypothetical protein